MPIRPENRSRYPKDWKAISAAIRERAGNRCEACGVPNGELGGRDPDGKWHKTNPKGERLLRLEYPRPGEYWHCQGWAGDRLRIIRIVLTVAHLDHTPENCDPANLRAWCQRCHNLYDQAHRRANAHKTNREKKALADLFQEPSK